MRCHWTQRAEAQPSERSGRIIRTPRKLNRTMERVVNLNATLLGPVPCSAPACSHAPRSCCYIVCLRFQDVQIKDLNNYKENTFRDIFEQLHTQEYKPTKKEIMRLQLNEKKSKEIQTRSMNWYWKGKPTWRKELITYNSHTWIIFSLNW